MTVVILKRRLPLFQDADTSGPIAARAPMGRYDVIERKVDHPSRETDYVKLAFGGQQLWACSRWKHNHYAEFEEQAPPEPAPLVTPPGTQIPEWALVRLLPRFTAFTYSLKRPRYPYEIPGVRVRTTGKKAINCCTFAEALLVRAFEDELDQAFHWGPVRHAQMMIFDAGDRFSPITAAVEANMGAAVDDEDRAPEPWTLVQGWRGHEISRGGHTFIVLDVEGKGADARILTLEANKAYQINGVGYRGLGNIERYRSRGLSPGAGWWDAAGIPSWGQLAETYPLRRSAKLHVGQPAFARS